MFIVVADAEEHVVFIHSTGTGPLMWSGISDVGLGGRKKHFPAHVGYPPGPLLPRGRAVTAAEDAAQVLAAVPEDGGRVHVVAHSYGALVALHAIPALGERLASAFFFEPVAFGVLKRCPEVDLPATEEVTRFMNHPWFLTDLERAGGEAWLEMFIDYWNRPGSWSKMPPSLREHTRALGWKMFQEVRSCFFDELPATGGSVPAPLTVAYGDRTTAASRGMSRAFERSGPHVTIVTVPDIGHMAPLTHPGKVYAEIARHFARVDSEAAA